MIAENCASLLLRSYCAFPRADSKYTANFSTGRGYLSFEITKGDYGSLVFTGGAIKIRIHSRRSR